MRARGRRAPQEYFAFAYPYFTCRIVFVEQAARTIVAAAPSLILLDADLIAGPNDCERPLALRRCGPIR